MTQETVASKYPKQTSKQRKAEERARVLYYMCYKCKTIGGTFELRILEGGREVRVHSEGQCVKRQTQKPQQLIVKDEASSGSVAEASR